MPKIETREQLKEYVHYRLGSPVTKTADLPDVQLENIIDMTLEKFYENAIGIAQEERILYFPVTEGDVKVDISDVSPQPSAIIETIDSTDGSNMWSNLNTLFTIENMMIHKWGFNLNTPDMLTLQMIYNWMDFFTTMYGFKYELHLNEHGKYVLLSPPAKATGGIFCLCYARVDEDILYRHTWVQEYAFAHSLVQIGMNRMKYSGQVMPGGGTLNGDMYITKGETMIDRLEQELLDKWSEPPNFIVR